MNKKSMITITALVLTLPFSSAAEKKQEKPKAYPLKTCIVSDEKLGEMGKPKYLNYKGQIYGFCCKPCIKDFKKNPEEFVSKLQKLQTKKK